MTGYTGVGKQLHTIPSHLTLGEPQAFSWGMHTHTNTQRHRHTHTFWLHKSKHTQLKTDSKRLGDLEWTNLHGSENCRSTILGKKQVFRLDLKDVHRGFLLEKSFSPINSFLGDPYDTTGQNWMHQDRCNERAESVVVTADACQSICPYGAAATHGICLESPWWRRPWWGTSGGLAPPPGNCICTHSTTNISQSTQS